MIEESYLEISRFSALVTVTLNHDSSESFEKKSFMYLQKAELKFSCLGWINKPQNTFLSYIEGPSELTAE